MTAVTLSFEPEQTLLVDSFSGEMDEPTEIEVLRQRLNDTQALYETLKNEVLLEREVSQELARRNDCLQKDIFESEEQMRAARHTAVGLESAVKSLFDQIGS